MRIKSVTLGIILVLIGSFAVLAATVSSTVQFEFDNDVTSIDVSGFNGTIQWVQIEEGQPVRIVAEKEARGFLTAAVQSHLKNMQVRDESRGRDVIIRAQQPRRSFGVNGSSVRFFIYAPVEAIESFRARTSNGSITVGGFQGMIDLRTSNGKITVSSGQGVATLRTSNGAVELGSVHFTDSSSVSTSNGKITGQVSFENKGRYSLETSNGSVDLRMPQSTEGFFDVSTSNGSVDFRLGPDVISGKSVTVRRGDTGSTIHVKTSNGSVSIRESY